MMNWKTSISLGGCHSSTSLAFVLKPANLLGFSSSIDIEGTSFFWLHSEEGTELEGRGILGFIGGLGTGENASDLVPYKN